MNTAQRIVKNTLSLMVSGSVSHTVAFITMVYLARVLGPDSFGKINFAMALVAYFTLLTNLGLPLLGTRELSKDLSRSHSLISSILLVRSTLAVISFSLMIVFVLILPKPSEYKYLILIFGVGLFFTSLSIDWVFQGIEKMEYIGLGRMVAAMIFLLFSLLFVRGEQQIIQVPMAQIAGLLFSSALLLILYFKNVSRIRFSIEWSYCKELLKQALPLGISLILIQVIYNIDTIMLGFMRLESEVGYYNAAYKVIMPMILLGSVYFDAVFPVISNYYETSPDSLKQIQGYNAKLMCILSFPVVVVSIVGAERIIMLLYGEPYNQSALPFRILVISVGLIYLNMIYARGMWACNRQNQYLKIVSGQVFVNIGLNFLLIPRFGMSGAAIATVFAELVGFYFYHRDFNRIVAIPIFRFIPKPFAACLLALPLMLITYQANLYLAISLFLAGYFGFLLLIKGITKTDFTDIISIIKPSATQ